MDRLTFCCMEAKWMQKTERKVKDMNKDTLIWLLNKLKEELEMDPAEYAKMVTAEGLWNENREMKPEDTYSYRIGVAISWIDHIIKEERKVD